MRSIEDPERGRAIRAKARRLLLKSLVATAAAMFLVLLLP